MAKQAIHSEPLEDDFPIRAPELKRLPLHRSKHRLSFERRLRIWLSMMGVPLLVLTALELHQWHVDPSVQWIVLPSLILAWLFLVSLVFEQIVRPLQTLANVVAALREDDYSFRARGGRRNDAMGDLALEINALAGMLQVQRVGAMEAMALVERVMKSMHSPVLAFDPEGRLKLLNTAAERAFSLGDSSAAVSPGDQGDAKNSKKGQGDLERLLGSQDNELLSLTSAQQSVRWVVKRTKFRLRGVPHTLFVLSDVSEALREEERLAWERLIRVLGHEINNSLTPIKSIAGSLRSRLRSVGNDLEQGEDFARGLEVIEDRAESLNRFLQAYRELMGLPAPKLESVSMAAIIRRVASLETRLSVLVRDESDLLIQADPDQLTQALINLVRNAAEASLSLDVVQYFESSQTNGHSHEINLPRVELAWERLHDEVVISVLDNGPGLSNASNLFVPFYTTKPGGTGIGLVLAQQIAMAHAGSVELVNRSDGNGCCARLRIPVHGSVPVPEERLSRH